MAIMGDFHISSVITSMLIKSDCTVRLDKELFYFMFHLTVLFTLAKAQCYRIYM